MILILVPFYLSSIVYRKGINTPPPFGRSVGSIWSHVPWSSEFIWLLEDVLTFFLISREITLSTRDV